MEHPKEVLREFFNLCVEARSNLDLYRSMFENDPTQTQTCLQFAPYFFTDINRIIIRTITLDVCKLTDPARMGSFNNLTTNYILEMPCWPLERKARLAEFNDLLMSFRKKLDKARNKIVSHTDVHTQIEKLEQLGQFNKGEEWEFFQNLQSFLDIAWGHVFNEQGAPPIALPASNDAYRVMKAVDCAANNRLF